MKRMNEVQKGEIRNLGIVLIVIGVIHFIASAFLSFTWGIILIGFGLFCVITRKEVSYLIFGILLAVIGLSNIVNSLFVALFIQESVIDYLWLILGGVQIYWGVITIIKYDKVRKSK